MTSPTMNAQTQGRSAFLRAHFLHALSASTILAGLSIPTMAAAQSATSQTAPAPAADAPGGLTEIVVTATHEKSSIQKVPISMQALSSATLEEHQVTGLSDLVTLLPSVSFEGIGPGRNSAFFRGIVPAGGTYASVGYYLDDIPITGVGAPDIYVYDIEQVEALSGPQGTLYGAGSLGGTIRFIPNKPKLGKLEFGMNVEGSKYGGHGAGGAIESYLNIPVTANLALRVMGYYRKEGGWINNTPNNGKFNDGTPSVLSLGDTDPATNYTLNNSSIAKNNYNPVYEYGTRIAALWEPVPGWDITPEITIQRQIADGYFGYDPRVGDLQVHDYDATRNDDKWYQAELSIHGHIGDFDFVSATGFHHRKIALNNDYAYYSVTYDKISQAAGGGYENYLQFFDKSGCTGSGATLHCTTLIDPVQYFHANTTQKKFTQELRLRTPKQWPFEITLGGFYQSQQNNNNNNYAIHGLNNAAGYTESGGQESNPAGFGIPTSQGGTMVVGNPAVVDDAFYVTQNDQYYHDEAVFAEGHVNVTSNLKLIGGIRYFWTDYEVLGFSGVTGSAHNTTTSLYVPTGTRGCPTPLAPSAVARLQCLDSNFAAADEVGRYKEHGETHKAAINWQFDPTKMLYFNYSTGFRPGGFNRPLRIRQSDGSPSVVATVPPFKSEKLTNLELGFKSTWNNIFRLNVAAYYETWKNIQYSVVVSGAQGAGITGNAGTAHVKGVEYDATLKLGKFNIMTNGAYNNAKLAADFCNFLYDPATRSITQLPSCAPVRDPNGNLNTSQLAANGGTRLPRQPKFKGSTTIRYDTEMGPYKAFFQGAVLYQTGATQDLNNTNNLLLGNTPGFESFNFSGGIAKGNYALELFINNAFDKRGQLTKNTFCSIVECAGSSRTFPIKPQLFGIKLSYKM